MTHSGRVFLNLIALALGAAGLARSGAALADCAIPANQSLKVEIAPGPAGQDRTLTIAQLSRLSSVSRRPGMEAYHYALGQTEADLKARTRIEILTTSNGQGGYCSAISTASVIIDWRTTVHIAAEVKPGSCIDRVVTRHEQRHVDLNRALMPDAQAGISAALATVAGRAVSNSSIESSRNVIQQRLLAAVKAAMKTFSAEQARRQLEIDTPEEYDKVPNACGEVEVRRLLGG